METPIRYFWRKKTLDIDKNKNHEVSGFSAYMDLKTMCSPEKIILNCILLLEDQRSKINKYG